VKPDASEPDESDRMNEHNNEMEGRTAEICTSTDAFTTSKDTEDCI